ncbi:WGR domain-containing protein [Oscillatoria salina]|uniref:WGR domain-containing protein n=1 Tax=Oscillatoria salina TaxID=331517 RepID=UPI001CCC08B3|nr:WGR domain-containing protein [Oscillatoria salina]MBZ8183294.1 WGR domain-containing protein [Oscillatoria salina IIICB1]
MELIKRTTLHFQSETSDKVYEVDLCQVEESGYLVNFRYGRRGGNLRSSTKTEQPVALSEAEKIFDKLVLSKTKSGYKEVTPTNKTPENRESAILTRLENGSDNKWSLERVIWRAGELKIKAATPFLINYIGTGEPLRDYCIAWALGRCGDEKAILHLRRLAENNSTPEFVQRIAWEAWFKLAYSATKNNLKEAKINQLSSQLQQLVREENYEEFAEALNTYLQTPLDTATHEFERWFRSIKPWEWEKQKRSKTTEIDRLPAEIRSQAGKHWLFSRALSSYLQKDVAKRYAIYDTLYQIDNEITRPAVLNFLKTARFVSPNFQAIRHIFKMAEYRLDIEVLALLSCRFDRERAVTYYAYSRRTREYLRRRIWRNLKQLGEENSSEYIQLAEAILLQYSDAEAQPARQTTSHRYNRSNSTRESYTRNWKEYGGYLVFNHILYENSNRYFLALNNRAWRYSSNYKPGDPEPKNREEAFPELWEKHPDSLLRLLLASEDRPVHNFAAKALRVCQEYWQEIDDETAIELLEKPYELTTELGFEIARDRYNPDDPNLDLIQALVNCNFAPARQQAHQWIEAATNHFLSSISFLTTLVTSPYQDTRLFARRLLSFAILPSDTAKILIVGIIAELLDLSPANKQEIIKDIADTLLQCFSTQLRQIGFPVILDLLDNSHPEIQILGAQILLNHETPATEIPAELIESLLTSANENIARIGLQIFAQLPETRLLEDWAIILAIANGSFASLRNSIRPIIQRLAQNYPDFSSQLVTELINLLQRKEATEGVHNFLILLLKEDIPGWMEIIDKESALKLTKAKSSAAQEIAGIVLNVNYQKWAQEFSTAKIVKLANHEILAIREAARLIFTENLARIRSSNQEKLTAVKLLEADWKDTQEFAWQVFNEEFTKEDWTPEVMISICDSIQEDVREFGRNLVTRTFAENYGQEYLLKFSEHPSADMQLFATNYLEEYAANDSEKLRDLMPYFISILSRVNKGRVAKNRVFAFLEAEANKSETAAEIVAEILTRQSLTIAIGDKAKAIQIMVKIKQKYPKISLPIQLKPVANVISS